jgi:outer membrane lipoprotein-sorting protein
MNRLVALSLVAVFILSAFIVLTPKAANGQGAGLVSSVLSRMEKNRASLKALRAGISMEKYNSQIGSSDRYNGVVLYMPGTGRNASVRIDWTSPQNETIAVADGKFMIYRPRLKQVIVGDSSKQPKPSGILEMMYLSRQQLEARFQPLQDVREETLWGGVSTIHLTLVPKGAASYKYAEIWIDAGGMPIQTKIVEKNDDATTMRLTALERNPNVSPKEFKLNLASDIKVVKG